MEYVVTRTENSDELYHYGVKGMKWGHSRRGISGTIRDIQRNRATRDLADAETQRKQVKRELSELRGYDRNPSKIGKSKISTAIRRNQIKSLEKMQKVLDYKVKDNQSIIKELNQIERYKAKKALDKQVKKNQKTSKLDNKKIKAGKKVLDNLLNDQVLDEIKKRKRPWDEKPTDPRSRGNI